MKSIFALALLLSCLSEVLMVQFSASQAMTVQSCMFEYGVTMQDVEAVRSHTMSPDEVKDNVKCAAKCIMDKLAFMDPSGNVQPENILAMAPSDDVRGKMEAALSVCSGVGGADPCDSAFRKLDCFSNNFDGTM